MKDLLKSKIIIIKFFKKYFIEKRKQELEKETELFNELNKKLKILNERLKQKSYNKKKIDKKIEKIQKVKSGKIEIINLTRYIIRFILMVLLYLSFLNISLNLKGYNYFIYISALIIVILSFLSMIITVIIKKKIFSAYYYNFSIKKIFLVTIISLGIGYFLNYYRKELELLNKKPILIKNIDINSFDDLKNSNIEIINKEGKIKWRIDKNLKILTYEEDSKKGIINIRDTVIDDNNKVTLSFISEKDEILWLKGKIIYFNWDIIKIKLKNKKTIGGEVYGKIIKLENGETLILNNNFELRNENKKIRDFGIMGIKLQIKKIINNSLFVFLLIFILLEYQYYNFRFREREKIITRLLRNEKNRLIIKKSVISILKTTKLLMFPIALIQTFLMKNYILNLFFDKNLKKGYDLISVIYSYFSKSYLLIFIILLLPVFTEIYKILKAIEKYMNTPESNKLYTLKKKRFYSRIMQQNIRKHKYSINSTHLNKTISPKNK